MSVLTYAERNLLTEESDVPNSDTDTNYLGQEENSIQNKQFEGVGNLDQSDAQCVSSAAQIHSENSELPEMFNRFHGQGLNSLDIQLASQILSSIRNKIATNMSYHTHREASSDSSTTNNTEFIEVKQEIPDEFIEFHHSSEEIYSYPQTSQPVYQRDCSTLSSDSYSLNHSPDSSVLSTYSSLSFPNTSPCPEGLSVNQLGVSQSELSPTAVSRSELSMSSCDSSQVDMAAMSKPMSKQANLLPPCRVCGEKASGFHYGANTCEACKGFFRRSLKKDKLDFKCNGDSSCTMQKGRRNNCALCRYNRCLSAGMSKDAIKTGRYTHEKRTQDIVEVKTLNGELRPDVLQSSFIKTEHPQKSSRKKALSEENREMLDRIYSAHKMIFPFWHSVLDSGSHKVVGKRHAEKYELQKTLKVDPCTSHMMPEEYDNYSNTKGVEQLGRKDTMGELTQHIELAIMAFVRYAKAVPGFTELPLNDQAKLVKSSRFEIWMIGAHKFMDINSKVVSGPRGKAYHMEELSEILDDGFVKALFSFSQSMQEIQLTNEETALLKCVALMFSDRNELQLPDRVQEIQERLTVCLEELLGSGQRFAKVMTALVRLRDLTEWNKTISENMVLEWPHMRQHPLLLEIMSV